MKFLMVFVMLLVVFSACGCSVESDFNGSNTGKKQRSFVVAIGHSAEKTKGKARHIDCLKKADRIAMQKLLDNL